MNAANSAKVNVPVGAPAATASSTPWALYLMIGSGLGFAVWFIAVMSVGIPSGNIATFGSKNALSKIGMAPFIGVGTAFLVATYFYMRSARSASQFIPLMVIPMISLFFSILALYFSLFQVTNRTSV